MLNLTAAGRIGRDASTKEVSGTIVVNFPLAVDLYEKSEKVTQWVDCAFWGQRAEKLSQYLTKGAQVTVTGAAGLRHYQSNDGTSKTALTLRVNDITLQGSKNDSGDSGGQENYAQQRSRSTSSPSEQAKQATHRMQQPAAPAATHADDFDSDIPF